MEETEEAEGIAEGFEDGEYHKDPWSAPECNSGGVSAEARGYIWGLVVIADLSVRIKPRPNVVSGDWLNLTCPTRLLITLLLYKGFLGLN